MERRLLVVFALTFLVIMLFQPLSKKYGPQPPAKPESAPAAVQNQTQLPSQTPTQPPPQTQISKANRTAGVKTPATSAPVQAASEAETVIENDVYRIVFTNRGGRVKSWVLKKFTDDKDGPLELVNAAAAEKFGYPLTLWSYREDLRNQLNSALYVVTSSGATAPAEIKFVYDTGGISVEKSFTFDRSSYVVGVRTAVYEKGALVTAFPMWPAGFGDQTSGPSYAASQIAYQYDSKVERLVTGWTLFPSIKILGGATVPGPFQWASVSDQYFAAVFLPRDPQNAALVTLRRALEIPHNASDPNNKQQDKVDVFGAAVGSLKVASDVRLYVGPKALADLQSVAVPGITGADPDLRAIIDFGWLGIIARPLFLWLKWMYAHIVANWGWAILLQTLVINLALLPLRLSQMKSMLKMQRVAPQIKAIQEKYKKYSLRDPKKAPMNEEISALYKKEGVNPAGGCLPLVIQMPFLFAFYKVLSIALDLRHAHWLWVHDLSAAEAFPFVLPILMVLSSLITSKMTPQAGMDPAQQRMMTVMMPLMMGFIFFRLPAGLNLYYATSNMIMIAQQAVMNRTSLGREMREIAAKRARKKDK